MREMQSAMDARVELTMRPSASDKPPAIVVKATAYPYLSTAQEVRQSVSLSASIPVSSATKGIAVIFRLLLALDYEVSKAWAVKQVT
jgi:hypothetical protein